MGRHGKLLLPALALCVLCMPAATAEAKVSVNDTEYDTLAAAVAEVGAAEATFTFTESETGNVTIPAGANYTINGAGMTLTGGIRLDAGDASKTTNVSIDNLVIDANGKNTGIASQEQHKAPTKLNLTVKNSTIKNAAGTGHKAMYITNANNLLIDNVVFENNSNDYGVDLNLVGVKDAEITIQNSTFKGNNGVSAAIKVAQRCYGDENPGDITCNEDTKATVKSLKVINNNFDADGFHLFGNVYMGANSAKEGSSNFPVEVVAGGSEKSTSVSGKGVTKFTVEAGKKAVVVEDEAKLASDLDDFALEVGSSTKLNHYLQSSLGKVDFADVNGGLTPSYASSDEGVATVAADGTVTAVKPGTATITVSYGDQTYQHNVLVKESMEPTPPAEDEGTTTDQTADETIDNPQTSDSMMMFVIAGMISAIGLVGAGANLNRETK